MEDPQSKGTSKSGPGQAVFLQGLRGFVPYYAGKMAFLQPVGNIFFLSCTFDSNVKFPVLVYIYT